MSNEPIGEPADRRRAFIDARRRSSRERYDSLHAPSYDRDWGAISPSHERSMEALLEMTRARGTVLDAACGTGKYWPIILDSGRSVVGTDQSAGMLEVARSKHPQVASGCVALQDLEFVALFDAIVCIDAVENVGPEDWPVVMWRLASAVRLGGPLYVTVELAGSSHLDRCYEEARDAGHPVVPGEDFDGVGYHYYPPRASVLTWLSGAGLEVIREADGDSYWHLVLRRGATAAERMRHAGNVVAISTDDERHSS